MELCQRSRREPVASIGHRLIQDLGIEFNDAQARSAISLCDKQASDVGLLTPAAAQSFSSRFGRRISAMWARRRGGAERDEMRRAKPGDRVIEMVSSVVRGFDRSAATQRDRQLRGRI